MAELGTVIRWIFCALLASFSAEAYFLPGRAGSYVAFESWQAGPESELSLDFSTDKTDGLLLYMDDGGAHDFLEVKLKDGELVCTLNFVDGNDGKKEMRLGKDLGDHEWHRVTIKRKNLRTTLILDDSETSKVSFGSDAKFGRRGTVSPVYVGGLPEKYRGAGLTKLSLPSAFYETRLKVHVRNLYSFVCSEPEAKRLKFLEGESYVVQPVENCLRFTDTCTAGCFCLSTDQGSECDCKKREACDEPIVHYHLPFDLVNGRTLVNPSGLDAEIQGTPILVPGVSGNAVELDGRNNFVRLVGPGHRYECFGDLQLCDNGYTMGLWINITDPGFNDIVYLSNGGHTSESHGVAMLYRNGHLEMRFRRQDGKEWRTKTDDILPHHWYHVAATWSTDNGLKLFINGNQVDHDPNPTVRSPNDITSENNEYLLGRPNDGTPPAQKGSIAMDEFHFWSEEKTPQQIRNAGPFYKFFLPMNWISSSGILLRSPAMVAEAKGGAKLVNGKIGTGVQLNGLNQYVDSGAYNDVCLGDIGQCWYGLTLGAWINVPKLQNGAYLIYTGPNGLSLYMEDNALFGRFVWNNRQWKVVFPDFKPGKWYFVELTWDKEGGAKMFIDLKEVSSQSQSSPIGAPPRDNNFYLGRSPGSPVTFAEATMDDVELWYGQRETLVRTKFILRGSPFHYFFDFNSMQGNLILNSQDDLNLTMRAYGSPLPTITEGKIFGALNLQGTGGQYLDFLQRGDSCFSNVNYCYFGFLVSMWINSANLTDKAYYISTGMNGLDVWYESGALRIRVDTWTRTLFMSTKKFAAGRWQFLEIDWDPYYGVSIWLDLRLVDNTARYETRKIPAGYDYDARYDNFYLGRGNLDMQADGYQYGMMMADYAHYYYSSRHHLLAFDWILRGQIEYVKVPFEEWEPGHLEHSTLNISLHGDPTRWPGKIGDAAYMNGDNQWIDLGDNGKSCMGNVELCPYGQTVLFWVNPKDLQRESYVISSKDYDIFTKNGRLYARYIVDDRKWEVSTDDVRAGVWQRVDVTWHPEKGLAMFVDDDKVDEVSTSVPVVPTDRTDTHVYVGRTTDMTNKQYFKGIVDELDVWYAPRSHLVANNYFKYENIDREKYVFERIENDKVVNTYDKNIVVYGNPTIGRGRDGPDIVLDGRNDYLDFGENVTCKGDLYDCHDGVTIRLLMKANTIRDNQYIMSGTNAEMYFEDGKLIGKFFSGDRQWRTETDVIEPGKWYLVALSWYAADGAHLHVNCIKSDHANRAIARPAGSRSYNRRFYVGRANTDMVRERYGDVEVEKLQIWKARRDYMDAYGLLNAECDPTATRAPETPDENPTIQCSGNTVLDFDNSRMNSRRNTNELLTIEFKASFKNGLLWYTENDEGKMFVTLQDSKAVVDFDFQLPSGRQFLSITSAASQLSDGNWHKIEVKKRNREVSVVVDDRYVETKRLNGDYYLASDKRTYLCGTPSTNRLTNYEIDRNYIGYIREATLQGDPSSPVTNYLDLVSKRPLDPFVRTTSDLVITYGDPADQTTRRPPVVITKLPPVSVTPTVTFHTDSSVVKINRWDALRTGTLEFRFKTSDPEGLIFYNGAAFGNRDFVAVEIFDGDLYLVANLGGTTHREKINRLSPVNDGVYHTVKIEHDRKKFLSTVDNHVTEMTIPGQDETLDLNTFLFVGGMDDFNNVNWHVWTRKGFKGCLRDLKVNFIDTDLQQFAEHQRVGGVSFGSTCGQPPLDCNNSPCTNGRCVNYWGTHKCRCDGTPYTGDRCEVFSRLISFTGDESVHVNFTKVRTTHTDDFTVRFRSSRPDGLIFTTDSKDNDFIRLCLKNGRAQLTVRDLTTVKTVDAGAGLNDNRWHTAWIRRRAEYVEVWIDGQLQHVVDTIPKSEFAIKMDNIYYGRYPENTPRSSYQNCENFIGQLQSATFQHVPIFGRIRQGDDGSGTVVTDTTSTGTRPDFKPVQFDDPGSHVGLRQLPRSRDVALNYMFKTLQHDGLLMLAGRPSDHFVGMELVDGWLHYLFNNGTTLETVRIGSPRRLNDNAWHRVELKLNTPNGPTLSVDDTITRLPDGTKFETDRLQGPLYIGGVPNRMYGTLPALVNSRDGFKGCFSSWVVNRVVLDLMDSNLIRNGFIREGCNVQVDRCNPNPCRSPGALCITVDNSFFCDCNMTAHVTAKVPEYCGFEAEGFRYGKTGDTGLVTYVYPSYRRPSTSEDRLAIGFMTWAKDGIIFRAEGRNYTGIAGNFIEVRLEDGYVVTEYKYTGGSGIIYDKNMQYNDGGYHVVRFERDNERTRMYVDNFPVTLGASSTGSSGQVGSVIFADQSYLFAGGRRDAGGTVYSAFDGIIAGVFWNGFRLLDWAMETPNKGSYVGDIFVAPHLFALTRPGGTGAVIGGGKGSAGSVLYAAPAGAAASVGVAATTGGIIFGILAALLLLATALMWALYKCKPGLLPCGGYAPVKTVPAAPLGAGGKVRFVNGAAAGNGVFIAGGGGGGFAGSENATGSFAAAGAAFTAASAAGAAGAGATSYKTVETETYDGIVAGAGGGGYRAAGGGGGGGSTTTTTIITSESYGAGGAGFAVAAGGGAGAHQRTVATNTLERSAGGGGGGYGGGGGFSKSWSESAGYGGGGYGGGGGGGGGAITTTTTEVTETLLAGGGEGGYGGGGAGYGAGYGGGGGGYGESYSASSYSAGGGYGGGGGAGGYGTGGASAYGGGYGGGAGHGSSSSYGGTLNRETLSPPPITNPQVVSIAPEVRVESFVITANGRYVITGSSMGPPQVWDSKTGDLIRSMSGDRLGSTDVHLACAESILAGLVTVEKIVDVSTIKRNRQLDMRLQLWGFESGQPLDMPSTIHATATVLMNDRDRLILGRTERHGSGVSVLMWDLGGNQMVNQYRHSAPAGSCDIVTHVDVTNDDKFAIAGFKHLFTGSTNFAVFDLNNPRAGPVIYSVDCDPDCLCLLDHHEAVVGTNEGEMIVWSLRTGQNLRTWGMTPTTSTAPHSDRITAMTQSRDYIVAASADTTLTMWDKETGEIQHRLVGHVDEVWCCAVTSTQDLIISGSRDNTIRLWRCKDGSEVSSFNALMDIFSLKVSNDKRVIVALGDRDHSRKLIMLQVLHSRQPKRHHRNLSDVRV